VAENIVQRQVLLFLTQHGPTAWEALHASFNEHHTSRIGLVLYEMMKSKHLACDSAKAVRITLLGTEYLQHGE
jgi:hypothetical protein